MEGICRILLSSVLAVLLLTDGIVCEETKHTGEKRKGDSGQKKAPVHDSKHVHNKEYVNL